MKLYFYLVLVCVLCLTIRPIYAQYSSSYKQHLRNYTQRKAVYVDGSYQEVNSKEQAKYLSIFSLDSTSKRHGEVLIYTLDSTLFEVRNYNSGSLEGKFENFYPNQSLNYSGVYLKSDRIGLWQFWYPNGKPQEELLYPEQYSGGREYPFNYLIKSAWDSTGKQTVVDGSGYYVSNRELLYKEGYHTEGKVRDGRREGIWKCLSASTGTVYYEEDYQEGKLIKGVSFDKDGNRYEYDTFIEKNAEPKLGFAAFYREIAQHVEYPKSARKLGIEGKVFLSMVINKEGALEDIKVIKGISEDCDAAAVKALKMVNNWNPGTQRGQPVKVRMSIPIMFKLN